MYEAYPGGRARPSMTAAVYGRFSRDHARRAATVDVPSDETRRQLPPPACYYEAQLIQTVISCYGR